MVKEPNIQCIFCDDVRREADGRVSLMGALGAFQIYPPNTTLPKLVACVMLHAPIGYKTGDIKIRLAIERNGSIEHSEDFPSLPKVAALDETVKAMHNQRESEVLGMTTYLGVIELQNFPIGDGVRIAVSAKERSREIAYVCAEFVVDNGLPEEKVILKTATVRKTTKGKKKTPA